MAKRKLSILQKAFREFFLAILSEYNVNSPGKLTKEQKSVFFTRIREEWKVKKAALLSVNIAKRSISKKESYSKVKVSKSVITIKRTTSKESSVPKTPKLPEKQTLTTILSSEEESSSKIESIGYDPVSVFEQGKNFNYPQVLMPKPDTKIKSTRKGCSNKTGYTEDAFFEYMQNPFAKDFQLYNNRHILSKNGDFVYEPDIVLINEKDGKNIFIDIEIDEPYEGFSRTLTHERGTDTIRNKFFIDRGWIVIRFSELQIHLSPKECCYHIAKLIAAIDPDYEIPFHVTLFGDLEPDSSWDSQHAQQWEKEKYREKYLGIDNFGTRPNIMFKYDIKISDNDIAIESEIEDTAAIPKRKKSQVLPLKNSHDRDDRLRFDPIEQKYYIDEKTDSISVSQLIDNLFPEFEWKRWSIKNAIYKLKDKGEKIGTTSIAREQKIILKEWKNKRENSANLQTQLHEQIVNYYNGLPYDYKSQEFKNFMKFNEKYSAMKPYRIKWDVFDEEYLVAGTLDAIYKNEDDELAMFQWKRSEKIIDSKGNLILPKYKRGYGKLSHLSDNRFNRFAIQQNICKFILEKRYSIKINSLNLLVLHPNFDTYHWVKLPDLTKEVEYIFENIKNYR